MWPAGAIVGFVYIGDTNLVMIDSVIATTSVYGNTILSSATNSSSETTAATSKAVYDALEAAKNYAEGVVTGATAFQGTVTNNSTISGSSYKKGWYWVVAEAGTYVGEECEIGDFVFCISDKQGGRYYTTDFKVVQANIDTNSFGDLAFADTASDTYTPAGTVSKPTFTGTQGSVSVKTSGAVTAVSVNTTETGGIDITPFGTITSRASGSSTANYTPAGTVSTPTFTGSAGSVTVTTGQAVTAVSGSVNTTSTNGIDIKPAGTVSTPTITVTPATGTVNSITNVGTLPTFSATVSNENLTFGWDSGTLPTKGSDTTVVTGITSATSTQPTFSGTQKYLHLSTTKDTVTSTGTFTPEGDISQPTFSGTGTLLEFAGTKKYLHTTKSEITATGNFTPAGDVSQPTFSGTEATITVEPDPRS